MYTLGEAARASGKSKSTIAKAVKSGRISAARGIGGDYQIDPAELHRVYPATGGPNGAGARFDTGALDGVPDRGPPGELAKWRALAEEREETIRDLRQRLDVSEDERRRVTRLLTDQRQPAVEEPQSLREALADAVAAERIASGEASALRAEVERLTRGRPWWQRWFR